jgi:hypothetical protein
MTTDDELSSEMYPCPVSFRYVPGWLDHNTITFITFNQSHKTGGASGLLPLGAVHVGIQNL